MRYWKQVTLKPQLVDVIAVAYFNTDPRRFEAFRCLLASLQAQTYSNWQLTVYHDGPIFKPEIARHPVWREDSRLKLVETQNRVEQFGHPNRALGIAAAEGEVLALTNDDNYFMPVYLEWLLGAMQQQEADLVYCNTIHSHLRWQPMKTKLRPGKIDVGGWLVKTAIAKKTPWTDFSFRGDGIYVSALARAASKVYKVESYLFVHN